MVDDTQRRLDNVRGSGGIGYAHAMPAREAPRTASDIRKRWERYWLAIASARSKLSGTPSRELEKLCATHSARMRAALLAQLPWNTIIHHDLDSPFDSEICFEGAVENALKLCARHIARIRARKAAQK